MNLKNLSELTFATADADEMLRNAISLSENILGRKIERADPIRLLLNSFISVIMQQRLLIDQCAKMNLLAYATGNFLEHLGALVGCERLPASNAVTTVEISLSTARQVSTVIKKNTRVTADDTIFFALEDDVIFLSGETVKQAKATCTVEGEIGNGFAAGELNHIVDPQPFLLDITNITTSAGGADIETDDAFRQRIADAPENFSCAGSEGAYISHTKEVSQLIVDVAVDSPIPGDVRIFPLMKGGELPQDEILQAVDEHLNAKTIRPLTDRVFVLPPEAVEYNIDVAYWISRDDAISAAAIEENVQAAAQDYISWQSAKLGRDINPSELIHKLKSAGADRIDVREPIFTVLDKIQVAKLNDFNVYFAGLKDN